MTREEILGKLKTIIRSQLGIREYYVVEDTKFSEDLGTDSLDHVELVIAFEEEFGIDIPDKAVEKMQTVGQAIDYISSKIAD